MKYIDLNMNSAGLITLGVALMGPALVSANAQGSIQSSGFVAGATTAPAPSSKSKTRTPVTPGGASVHNYAMTVRNGILTVDGMVGKAQMNYDIKQDFLYFTVPGVGTAIVAQEKFMNALPQKNAFKGNTLTIDVNGHSVQLTNDGPLAKGKEQEAWVSIDPLYGADIRFPEMGFGSTIQRPYVWPGSKEEKPAKDDKRSASAVVPPPLPVSIRPKPEVSSTYSVTVPAAPAVNGGDEKKPPQ
jgi:hypothetical protein